MKPSWRKGLTSLATREKGIAVFMLVFGVIGSVLLIQSFAAGAFESIQPEAGALSGNLAVSSEAGASGAVVTFGSNGLSLSITGPLANATVSDTISLKANYSGNIQNVEFFNGANKIASATLNAGVATASFNTSSVSNGTVTIVARAWDAPAGSSFTKTIDSAPVSFTIQNQTSGGAAPRQPVINVKDFGAKGDGSTNDSAAINAAINSLNSGGTVSFPAGTYVQANLIDIRKNGVSLWTDQGATIKATNENENAIRIYASDNGIYNLNLTSTAVGRGDTFEQNRITTFGVRTTIKSVHMTGSKAAGIMMEGASDYLIENNTIDNTLSDSIHSTGGSNHGVVRGNIVRNGGDDCIANVTYGGQPLVNNVLIENNECYNGHARHFSVIGGHDITFQNNLSDGSSVAAAMIASEPSYNTEAPYNIKLISNRFKRSNTGAANSCCSNHGSIHIWAGRPGYSIHDILIANNTVDTQVRGPAMIVFDGGDIKSINFIGNTLTGSTSAFQNIGVASGNFNIKNNTYNGSAYPNQITNSGIIPAGY